MAKTAVGKGGKGTDTFINQFRRRKSQPRTTVEFAEGYTLGSITGPTR